jgi:hypothetical protein
MVLFFLGLTCSLLSQPARQPKVSRPTRAVSSAHARQSPVSLTGRRLRHACMFATSRTPTPPSAAWHVVPEPPLPTPSSAWPHLSLGPALHFLPLPCQVKAGLCRYMEILPRSSSFGSNHAATTSIDPLNKCS